MSQMNLTNHDGTKLEMAAQKPGILIRNSV